MKIIKVTMVILLSTIVSSGAWATLRCQTTIISPGLSIDKVKSLCGEPADETEIKENLICSQFNVSNCQKIYTQELTYKRPSVYVIEFQNDKVFRVIGI